MLYVANYLPASGGTPLLSGKEIPTGTVDGSNTAFTVTNTPVYIVSDGVTYLENKGYTLSGLNVTMDYAPTGFIESFY